MNKRSKLYKELSYSEIKNILEDYFGGNINFDFNLISGGLFNTTYKIKINNEKEIILRVGPINKELLLKFEQNLMLSEIQVYKLCEEKGIPCSKVIYHSNDNKIINREYMIVEYIESKPLLQIDIPKDKEREIYKKIGQYIKKINSIEAKKFGRVFDVYNDKGFDLWSEYLKSEILDVTSRLKEFNLIDTHLFKEINSIVDKYKETLDEINEPKLIHNDLWAGNILINYNNDIYDVVAIIDADRAIFGDINFEFTNCLVNDSVMEGYGEIKQRDEIRSDIYTLVARLIETYVWYVEYDNEECGKVNMEIAMEVLKKLR